MLACLLETVTISDIFGCTASVLAPIGMDELRARGPLLAILAPKHMEDASAALTPIS